MANWFFFRRNWYCHEPLKLLPLLFQNLNVDWVLVGGDLSSTSLNSEFKVAKDFFDEIKQPKIFIPGNHDQYTKNSHRKKRFYNYFKNHRKSITHPLEFFTLPEHGVEAHRLDTNWWCIALDTAPPTHLTSSNGKFSPETEKHLTEILESLPKDAQILMLNHFPFFDNDLSLHRLIHADRLRGLIERFSNVRIYLHGHTHRHTIADLRPNHLPLILDSGCPIQKPLGTWNLIDLTLDGCNVQGYQWNQNNWEIFREASFQLDQT